MAFEFKRLADVEQLDSVPDGANALVEINGNVKRVPGSGLGGGGIKTAVIKSSDYDNTLAGLQAAAAPPPVVTYTCVNMTFEEAYQTMAAGEPLGVVFMLTGEGGSANIPGFSSFVGTAIFGIPCIAVASVDNPSSTLYWTTDGLSETSPEGEK